jgi:hypothetical protein
MKTERVNEMTKYPSRAAVEAAARRRAAFEAQATGKNTTQIACKSK